MSDLVNEAIQRALAEDAEDLISRVFHRFLERLCDFDSRRGSVLSWLLTMARNGLIDHYRQRKETVPVEGLAETLPGRVADPLAVLIRDEQAQYVASLLQDYPAEIKEMMALRFAEGMRYREIGALLGLSEAAVKQRMSRTLGDLRTRLARRRTRGGEVDYAV